MPPARIRPPRLSPAAAALGLCGCAGRQSALDPSGEGAERIATLFWWMAAGAAGVWLVVVALTVFAIRSRPETLGRRRAATYIIGGGAVFPTVVLAALLVYGLALMPRLLASPPEGSLRISVTGEQWWWRVRYERPGEAPVELANEIRLPVGEPVEFRLDSADVIHAFWVPPLGGKMDMIPGRVNRLTLRPTRTGTFRGACAEYCGGPHALMAFDVVVAERPEFESWLAGQSAPAREPADPLAARGRDLFLSHGCGACHAIRGTPAVGAVGPDLTHVGSRLTLAAATVPNDPDDFHRWIAKTDDVKPGVRMPEFGMLPPDDLKALAAYLDGLE